MIKVYFDGLCQPRNPGGVATYGFVVYERGKRLHAERGLAAAPWTPRATNNVAEYSGVVKALEWLAANGKKKKRVVVRGDSQLAIRQLNGEYKVKSPNVAPLFARARELSFQFSSLRFEWIPREQNREADALTNLAYAEFESSAPP